MDVRSCPFNLISLMLHPSSFDAAMPRRNEFRLIRYADEAVIRLYELLYGPQLPPQFLKFTPV